LETKISPSAFKRLDAEIGETLLDKDREHPESSQLVDFIKGQFEGEEIEVEAKSLSADHLPGLITMDENQRRLRDYMRSMDPNQQAAMMGKRTFVVNTNNRLVNSIEKLSHKNPDLAKELVHQVYDLALLSQKEMDAAAFSKFVQRSNQILAELTEKLVFQDS